MKVNFRSNERVIEYESILLGVDKSSNWDQARYDKWLQEGKIPVFGKLQGNIKTYTKRAVIGQVADDVYVLVRTTPTVKQAFAYVKTDKGPVLLVRGPYGWNPMDDCMLKRLCRHLNRTRRYDIKTGYIHRVGEDIPLFVIHFGEREKNVYAVSVFHPWHPEYGIRARFGPYKVMRYPLEVDEENEENMEERAIFVELKTLGQAELEADLLKGESKI